MSSVFFYIEIETSWTHAHFENEKKKNIEMKIKTDFSINVRSPKELRLTDRPISKDAQKSDNKKLNFVTEKKMFFFSNNERNLFRIHFLLIEVKTLGKVT